jgi:hypothetical protein
MRKSGDLASPAILLRSLRAKNGGRKFARRFSARIPLQAPGIDHVHDFGSIESKIIVI